MRLISRRMTSLGLEGAQTLALPFGGDLDDALIFTAVACSNLAPYTYRSSTSRRLAEGRDTVDEGLRRPISTRALSAALALPFETVRRRCQMLETAGFFHRAADGLIVPPVLMADGPVRQSWLNTRKLVLNTLNGLRALGVDLESWAAEAKPPKKPLPPMVQSRIVLDAVYRLSERWREPWGGQLGNYLIHCVLDANVRWLDDDPEVGLRYGYLDTPVPDALRRPVYISDLARRLSLPRTTVDRWVQRFISEGWLTDGPKGLIVTAETLARPEFATVVSGLMIQSLRMVTVLKEAGFFERKQT